MSQGCFRPGGLSLTEQLVDYAQFPPEATILDLGCGDGTTVNYLIQRGYRGLGIDGKVNQQRECIARGDMTNLPFADEQLDGVISECSLSVCGDLEKVMNESYRVLKQGGWLLISDVVIEEYLAIPLDRNQWYGVIEQAGFCHIDWLDASPLWKEFVIEQLWAGKTIEELWCGALPVGCDTNHRLKVGYFLLWAKKGE